MPKKLLSTILLFLVFIVFLWWGLSMLTHPDPTGPAESVVVALLFLGCSGYALVCIVMLPFKKEQ